MTLRLYDTAARRVRDFVPLVAGRPTVYLCGATVQSPPHIGHVRSGVCFDVLARWLAARGDDVVLVRNVTDIDDKIISVAAAEGVPYWSVAIRNERAFSWAYDVLGCRPPAYEPRATGHVPEMIMLMDRLVRSGHAYPAGGDVYFDVRSFPAYGALSGQQVADMQPAADSESSAKRDPVDFALWKGARPGEPSWDTPWGPGRPGWHLECSAMATKYLGATFDIHGGGLDLVFPHHENEIAQSVAAGDPFARYWMHNAWVTTAGEKMSKSLGNSLLVTEVVRAVRPVELRYYLTAAHYRSTIEYSPGALADAGTAYRRIEGFLHHATERTGPWVGRAPLEIPAAFAAAMDDDLSVPQALAVLHETVRAGNAALDRGDDAAARVALAEAGTMAAVLGINPYDEPWTGSARGSDDRLRAVVDALVSDTLQARAAARARRDFATADALRDRLAAAGVRVEDTPAGARWTLVEEG